MSKAIASPTKDCIRCERTLPIEQFPTATTNGKTCVRAWCRECLASYYQQVNERRRSRTLGEPRG